MPCPLSLGGLFGCLKLNVYWWNSPTFNGNRQHKEGLQSSPCKPNSAPAEMNFEKFSLRALPRSSHPRCCSFPLALYCIDYRPALQQTSARKDSSTFLPESFFLSSISFLSWKGISFQAGQSWIQLTRWLHKQGWQRKAGSGRVQDAARGDEGFLMPAWISVGLLKDI